MLLLVFFWYYWPCFCYVKVISISNVQLYFSIDFGGVRYLTIRLYCLLHNSSLYMIMHLAQLMHYRLRVATWLGSVAMIHCTYHCIPVVLLTSQLSCNGIYLEYCNVLVLVFTCFCYHSLVYLDIPLLWLLTSSITLLCSYSCDYYEYS
jgi:hypothetical protein